MRPIILRSCRKAWTGDLDKARRPEETTAFCQSRLAGLNLDILARTARIDNGRLGIPVFMAVAGTDARAIMPTRKQMGKGASPEQAEASAMMELMERFAFFSFWRDPPLVVRSTWSSARKRFGDALIPVAEILASVSDRLDDATAAQILDTREWLFYPATRLKDNAIIWLPIDWFRMLGEFNGSCAGNTNEEAILQGLCELIERHVCALVSRSPGTLATIRPQSCGTPVLERLMAAFDAQGIHLLLKDISLDMPMPTVAAIAWDPQTFPASSEIVFTAGTASSPAKAAIRAITEVAQLAGDFNSGSCYEASGLPKFTSLEDAAWLLQGPEIDLNELPGVEDADILRELLAAVNGLGGTVAYAVETTNPEIGIPAHWVIAPGLQFRERDANQSLGLFVGRKLAEESEPEEARRGLRIIAEAYPGAHFLPFFEGLISLREGRAQEAAAGFARSLPLQPDAGSRGLAAFYAGYAHSQTQDWLAAIPWLERALAYSPDLREAANLLGVAFFKTGQYARAEGCFDTALKLDKGSAMDLANRGICRKLQQKSDLARADLEAALALDPALDFARAHLAELGERR